MAVSGVRSVDMGSIFYICMYVARVSVLRQSLPGEAPRDPDAAAAGRGSASGRFSGIKFTTIN